MSLDTVPNPQAGIPPPAVQHLNSDDGFSRSPTYTSDDETSDRNDAGRTLTDLNGSPVKGEKALTPSSAEHLPAQSTMGKVESDLEKSGQATPHHHQNALSSLAPGRKNVLLLCFCLSMFIDAAGVSATFLMTAPIAEDLGISVGNQPWILATYSSLPPHRIYTFGFIGIAIFYLIISFMENQYAFFVLRAISGLLAVLTIPSSINMIIQMYPDPAVQAGKLALFGMAGALANTIALVLAGVFMLSSWRWYFRFITIIIAPFSVLAWFLLPTTEAVAQDLGKRDKIKRMDLVGVGLMVASLILFILGFTQTEMKGWGSAIFIAPVVIGVCLFAAFVVYEQYLPRGYSLLPHDVWRFPNIFPLMFQASAIFMWFATAQLRLATFFQIALHDSAILSAVKLLPMGIAALVVGTITQFLPWLITRPRYVQPIAGVLCAVGSILFAVSNGGPGKDYWRYLFPGQIIGTAGGMIVFIGMNTTIIQAFPLEFAGVGGSFANIIFQIGGVIGISIQGALLSTGDGTIQDWEGSKNGYWFTTGYILLTSLVFVLTYRQHKMPQHASPIAAV